MIATVTLNASVDKLYLVENMAQYTVMRVKSVNNTAGGKGMNLSRVAAIAGEPVIAIGIIGGFTGQYFMSLAPKENFTPHFTEVEGELRNCVNAMDLSTGKSTEFLEPGLEASPADLERFIKDYEYAAERADIVTISGSAVRGAPDDFYARLIHIAKKMGKRAILDASGTQLSNGIEEKPYMVKPNMDEICPLCGIENPSEADLINAARMLRDKGIEIAAISRGSEGVLLACEEGIYKGTPPKIKPVNTVGCGDSMIAGFAIGAIRGYGMERTIDYAMALAAANALTSSTGSFYPEDLERLIGKGSVERL